MMTITAVVIIVRVSGAIYALCLPSFSARPLRVSALACRVIQVHFVISISNYYSHLSRSRSSSTSTTYTALRPMGSDSLHRIFLLPTPTASSSSRSANGTSEVYVYSPVPLSSLSEEQAREMQAAEAWISHTEPSSRSSHRPTHRHHHSGRISLPVRSDEGLLPKYEKSH